MQQLTDGWRGPPAVADGASGSALPGTPGLGSGVGGLGAARPDCSPQQPEWGGWGPFPWISSFCFQMLPTGQRPLSGKSARGASGAWKGGAAGGSGRRGSEAPTPTARPSACPLCVGSFLWAAVGGTAGPGPRRGSGGPVDMAPLRPASPASADPGGGGHSSWPWACPPPSPPPASRGGSRGSGPSLPPEEPSPHPPPNVGPLLPSLLHAGVASRPCRHVRGARPTFSGGNA